MERFDVRVPEGSLTLVIGIPEHDRLSDRAADAAVWDPRHSAARDGSESLCAGFDGDSDLVAERAGVLRQREPRTGRRFFTGDGADLDQAESPQRSPHPGAQHPRPKWWV